MHKEFLMGNEAIAPVSYTHLDVYKRQDNELPRTTDDSP